MTDPVRPHRSGGGIPEYRATEGAPPMCRRCGGVMREGVAIQQTFTGLPDFPGGDVVTLSPGGTGRLVGCMKCERCGWSVG